MAQPTTPAERVQTAARPSRTGPSRCKLVASHYMAIRDESPTAPILLRLRTAALRPTRQRIALAGLLFRAGDRHVTAEQLHQEALAEKVRVSLATVYNTLHQFTDVGLLREVVVEAGRSYFDTNVSDHHHFFLVDSGRLVDIAGERVAVQALPEAPHGTTIERIDVIVRLRNQPGTDAKPPPR